MTMSRKKGSTVNVVVFFADSADGKTGKTGLSPTITVSKDGGAFGALHGSVSEISSGDYKVVLDGTDTNTDGAISLHGTGTGADNVDALNIVDIVEYDPMDAVALGLSRIDAAITSRLAPTVAARTLDVSAGGEAGLDWANVGSPTTVVGLSGTTIKDATDVSTATTRALGLLHENSVDDNHVFSGSNLTSCRKRVFSSKANALAAALGAADNADGEVARYLLTFTYTGSNLASFRWVRDL